MTGAAGFTGRHLVDRLVSEGWSVVATDLEPPDRTTYYTETDNAPHPVYDPSTVDDGATFESADLTEPATLEPLFDGREYDAVFHLASLFDYFAECETLEAVNVKGARNVATLAADNDVGHFVHVSTLGVLGSADDFTEPRDETTAYDPHNRYCESKQRQEELLEGLAAERDLPLTIIRPGPIYGPGNRYGVYHIPLVLARMGVAPVFRIYPRDRQLMFPSVHVADLTRIALFVHERRQETVGETYHAVSDCLPQDELVEFLGEAVGVPTVRVPIPAAAYRGLATYAEWHAERIEGIAREKDTRPKIDAAITHYLSHNMWYDNRKIRDLGYSFEYRDPKAGLWDYVTWCKSEGLLP